MTMEVILSVAFGLQTNFQINGDEVLTKEAMDWFVVRRSSLFIGMLLIVDFYYI